MPLPARASLARPACRLFRRGPRLSGLHSPQRPRAPGRSSAEPLALRHAQAPWRAARQRAATSLRQGQAVSRSAGTRGTRQRRSTGKSMSSTSVTSVAPPSYSISRGFERLAPSGGAAGAGGGETTTAGTGGAAGARGGGETTTAGARGAAADGCETTAVSTGLAGADSTGAGTVGASATAARGSGGCEGAAVAGRGVRRLSTAGADTKLTVGAGAAAAAGTAGLAAGSVSARPSSDTAVLVTRSAVSCLCC